MTYSDYRTFEFEASVGQPNTPLANEILGNLFKFPHCILLTRVGQFYEVSLNDHNVVEN